VLLGGGSRAECQEGLGLLEIGSEEVAPTLERGTRLLWTGLDGGGPDIVLRGPGRDRSMSESSLVTGGRLSRRVTRSAGRRGAGGVQDAEHGTLRLGVTGPTMVHCQALTVCWIQDLARVESPRSSLVKSSRVASCRVVGRLEHSASRRALFTHFVIYIY
jgi:hypothetical protein